MVQYLERTLRQCLTNGIEIISKASFETKLHTRRYKDAILIRLPMLIQCLPKKLRDCLDNDINTLWKSGIEPTLYKRRLNNFNCNWCIHISSMSGKKVEAMLRLWHRDNINIRYLNTLKMTSKTFIFNWFVKIVSMS